MRVIAGAWRGRRLIAPAGRLTRPTADRARQTLFDVLWHASWGGRALLEGSRVLDAFAGTGALGIEALSRGAAEAVFLETDPAAIAAIRANLRALRAEARARVIRADATAPPPAEAPARLVLLDPPYGRGLVEATVPALLRAGWIATGTIVAIETAAAESPAPERLSRLDERRVGAARLGLYRAD